MINDLRIIKLIKAKFLEFKLNSQLSQIKTLERYDIFYNNLFLHTSNDYYLLYSDYLVPNKCFKLLLFFLGFIETRRNYLTKIDVVLLDDYDRKLEERRLIAKLYHVYYYEYYNKYIGLNDFFMPKEIEEF